MLCVGTTVYMSVFAFARMRVRACLYAFVIHYLQSMLIKAEKQNMPQHYSGHGVG